MKRFLIATSLICAFFGGLSLARPHAFESPAAKRPDPAPIDLESHGKLETATFALG